jgi:hypothetical protein
MCHDGVRINFISYVSLDMQRKRGRTYDVFDELDAGDVFGETFGKVGEDGDI